MVEMVFPGQANHYGTLFGGHALKLMDQAAFVAASRFAREQVVTVHTEEADFRVPVHTGQLVEVAARVVDTGHTSVRVEVELYSEELLTGKRDLCTTSTFVLVAVDEAGDPVAVPTLDN